MTLLSFMALSLSIMPVSAAELKGIQYNKISDGQGQVVVDTDEELSFKLMFLPGAKTRLVVDFMDASYKMANKQNISETGILKSIRLGRHSEPLKTRMVLDLDSSCQKEDYAVSKNDQQVMIDLNCSGAGVVAENMEAAALPVEEVVVVAPAAPVVAPIPPVASKVEDPDYIFGGDAVAAEPKENFDEEKVSVDNGASIIVESISHEQVGDSQEMVVIHLTDFVNPTLTAVDGDQLTVLCELPNVKIAEGVIKDIEVGGRFIDSIHSEIQYDGSTLISLYLDSGYTYDLNQVFYKKENVLTLVVHSN